MSLIYIKIITATLVFLVALSAAWIPFKRKQDPVKSSGFPIGEALASGVFLGAGLLHLLPDASASFSALNYDYPLAALYAGIVFLILLLMEHVGRELYNAKNCTNKHHKHAAMTEDGRSFAVIAVIMLSIHSFFAGAALGLSTNLTDIVIIALAIFAHKWVASFALAVEICKSKLSIKNGLMLFVLFALMVPAGILFGNEATHFLSKRPTLAPMMLSFAAGTFLYLGTLHGLQRSVMIEKCCDLKHFAFVIAGFLIMALVAVWV